MKSTSKVITIQTIKYGQNIDAVRLPNISLLILY